MRLPVPAAALFFAALTLGCTSLPIKPAGGLTLVTLDHIEERDRALRAAFDEEIETRVADAVREAREADRERLQALADALEQHRAELESLGEQVASNADMTLELAKVVGQRLDALASESQALERQARALQAEIGGLPLTTLDQLRRVIGAHVETERAIEARRNAPPPAPAPQRERAAVTPADATSPGPAFLPPRATP